MAINFTVVLVHLLFMCVFYFQVSNTVNKRKLDGYRLPLGPPTEEGRPMMVIYAQPNSLLDDTHGVDAIIQSGEFEGCKNKIQQFVELALESIGPTDATFKLDHNRLTTFSSAPNRREKLVVFDCKEEPRGNDLSQGCVPPMAIVDDLKKLSHTLFNGTSLPIFWVISLGYDGRNLCVDAVSLVPDWSAEASLRCNDEMTCMVVAEVCRLNQQFTQESDRKVVRMALSGGRAALGSDGFIQSEKFDERPCENGKSTQVVIVSGSISSPDDEARIVALNNEFLRRGASPRVVEFNEDENDKELFSINAAQYPHVDILYFDLRSLKNESIMSTEDLCGYFSDTYAQHSSDGTLLVPDLVSLEDVTRFDIDSLPNLSSQPKFTRAAINGTCEYKAVLFGDRLYALEARVSSIGNISAITESEFEIDTKLPHIVSVLTSDTVSVPTDRFVGNTVDYYRSCHTDEETAEFATSTVNRLISQPGFGNVILKQTQLAKLLSTHPSNLSKCMKAHTNLPLSSYLGTNVMLLAARMTADPEKFLYHLPTRLTDAADINLSANSGKKQKKLNFYFEDSTAVDESMPTISFRKPCTLTDGQHVKMEGALINYAKDTQPNNLSSRTERYILAKHMWRIKCGIEAADTTSVPPEMDPDFKLGMMGLDKIGVQGRYRGALRTYWTTYAIESRIKGCEIERQKTNPDRSKFCGLRQTTKRRQKNDMRHICRHCNIND